MFNNIRELVLSMPTEQECRDYLVQQRWNGTPVCPYCGCDRSYKIEGGKRYKCADKTCHKKYSVTVGTVFEDSNIALSKWFMAIYIFSGHKKGISSYQLGKDIGCTQKTAWFMLHRLRELMRTKTTKKLDNYVEADLTHVGGSISNKHSHVRKAFRDNDQDWQENKTTTLGMIERGGNLMLKVIEKHSPRQVQSVVRENLEFAANIMTDEAIAFKPLNDIYYHSSINHSRNEYARLHIHTNTIEGVFSHVKRMIYGIYHQISPQHTQRYMDEFMFRFNSRDIKDSARFVMALKQTEGRLDYKTLTNHEPAAKKKQKPNPNKLKAQSKPVIQRKGDEFVATYPSLGHAWRATGISVTAIQAAVKGKTSNAGGYQWDFA